MSSFAASSWNSWLAEYAGRFLLFARQQTRTEHDAEDVLQESLVEAWQRSGGAPQPALVFSAIRRRAIDLGRRHDRRARREEAASAVEAPWFDFHPTGADDEVCAILEQAVKSLPPEQCDVVTLKMWGGLTFAATATALGIPRGTAATRYRTALESLRKTLTPVLS